MPKLRGVGMAGNHKPSTDYCSGCGLHRHVTGEHRPDCTAHPSALHCGADGCGEVRPAGAKAPIWMCRNGRYYCPTHREETGPPACRGCGRADSCAPLWPEQRKCCPDCTCQ